MQTVFQVQKFYSNSKLIDQHLLPKNREYDERDNENSKHKAI